MQIGKNKVAVIDYTLTDDKNTILDSSSDGEPLSYIHGSGNLIPGLEKALVGKVPGDTIKVSIAPKDGYGMRDDALLQVIPSNKFEAPEKIQAGMQFHTQDDNGTQVVTVVSIEGDKITIDGNHPLAGMTLNFDVKIVDVRDATAEELSHGHVHGPGGHHH